jgi:hypothetical protein
MESVMTIPADTNQAAAQLSSEYSQLADAIDALHQAVMEQPRDKFLQVAMYHLHRILNAEYIIAGIIPTDNPKKVKSAMVLHRGCIVPNIEYDLEGTPCEQVVTRNACCFPSNVAMQFPDDAFLLENGIQGYVGAPICGDDGKRHGLILALTRQPIENSAHLTILAELFAMTIAQSLSDTHLSV